MTNQTNAPVLSYQYFDEVIPLARGFIDGERKTVKTTRWGIRRFEDGKMAGVMTGDDFAERDRLLTKIFAAGAPCEPLVVGGRKPTPFTGGFRK